MDTRGPGFEPVAASASLRSSQRPSDDHEHSLLAGEQSAARVATGARVFSFFPFLFSKDEHPENLTCKQALLYAKRQCMNIRHWKDLVHYFYMHRQTTFFLVVTLSMIGLLCFGLIFYYEPRKVVYKDLDVPVLHGYDLVAYFSLGKWSHATRGRPSISYHWTDYNWTDTRDGSTYSYVFWFSSEDNRRQFINNPWKYVPRFGGFSAYKTATEDFWKPYPDASRFGAAPFCHPDAFIIGGDGALYMEYSLEYKKLFMESSDVIAMAEKKWKSWYGSLRSGPLNNFAVRGRFSTSETEKLFRTLDGKTV